MFKDILKKIADEYKADQTYFGGDAEQDLCHSLAGVEIEPGMCRVPVSRAGYIHALYDLGVLEALPAPAEGEVRVHADRAKQLLTLVGLWQEGAEVMVAKVTRKKAEPIVLEADENPVAAPGTTYSVQRKLDRNDSSWLDDLVRHPTLVSAIEEAQALLTRRGIAEVRIVAHDSHAANTIRIIHKNSTTKPAPDPAVVRDALLLVGVDVPSDEIKMRTDPACAEALEWAHKAHLNASNCTIEVPACPEWVARWRKP
jgi:hypothetical protein